MPPVFTIYVTVNLYGEAVGGVFSFPEQPRMGEVKARVEEEMQLEANRRAVGFVQGVRVKGFRVREGGVWREALVGSDVRAGASIFAYQEPWEAPVCARYHPQPSSSPHRKSASMSPSPRRSPPRTSLSPRSIQTEEIQHHTYKESLPLDDFISLTRAETHRYLTHGDMSPSRSPSRGAEY